MSQSSLEVAFMNLEAMHKKFIKTWEIINQKAVGLGVDPGSLVTEEEINQFLSLDIENQYMIMEKTCLLAVKIVERARSGKLGSVDEAC